MREYYPLLLVGAIVSILATIFIIAFATMKDKKEAFGFERNMKDGEIVRRLLKYAKPYWKNYILIFAVLIVAIAYDIISPRLVGSIEELVKGKFEMPQLLRMVFLYAGILIISLVGNYIQAIQLQKVGQKILTAIREDLFVHITRLKPEQQKNPDAIVEVKLTWPRPENTANGERALADYIKIIQEEKRKRTPGGDFARLAEEIKKQKGYGG